MGGFISRTVKGKPDDSGMGFLYGTKVNDFLALSTSQKAGVIEGSNENDFESDVYNFNFLGISGKFYFDQNGDVLSHPKSDVRVEKIIVNTKIKGWKITNTDGIIYYFGVSKDFSREANDTTVASSTTQSKGPGWTILAPSEQIINTWHLMDIEISNGKIFSYEYLSNTINYWNIGSQDYKFPGNTLGPYPPITTVYVNSQDVTHRVSKMITDQGQIEFLYETPRIDLKGDFCLTEVNLKNNNNIIIDSYKFDYAYNISNPIYDNPIRFENSDQRTKRLLLKKITQQMDNTENKTYSFDYHEDMGFPERLSYSQDHWGFFNGKINHFYFPDVTLQVNNSLVSSLGGNKKVDIEYSKALTLKKITYPTKGYSTFEYESNTSSNIIPHSWIVDYQDVFVEENNTYDLYGEKEKEIILTNYNSPSQTFSWEVFFDNQCSSRSAIDCPRADLFKFVNGNYELLSTTYGEYIKETFLLPENGELRLKIKLYNYSNAGLSDNSINNLRLRIFKSQPITSTQIPVGGLRILKAKHYNFNNVLLSQKQYQYNFFDEPFKSSGLIQNTPVFLLQNYLFGDESGNISTCQLLKSDAIFSLYNGGNSVSYSDVTEIFNDGTIGKNEYSYSFASEGAGLLENLMFATKKSNGGASFASNEELTANFFIDIPKEDHSNRTGLLIKKKVYSFDKPTNKYLPIEQEEYEYNLASTTNSIRTKNIFIKSEQPIFGYCAYNNFSENIKLQKIVSKSFFNGKTMLNTVSYLYDSDNYYSYNFPKFEEKNNSKGETRISQYFYPYHVTTTTSLGQSLITIEKLAIDELTKKNKIAQPIQTIISNKNSLENITPISTQRINFNNFGLYRGTNSKVIKQNSISFSKENLTLETKITFDNYDSLGNLRQYTPESGIPITYIWGYNQTQPIAKIENATYDQVQQYETNLQTLSNGTNEAALLAALNALRTNLPGAMVTTYTYKPLIGVSTITDAKGDQITYSYDSFNRLQFVKDKSGNILSENQYNYKQ